MLTVVVSYCEWRDVCPGEGLIGFQESEKSLDADVMFVNSLP